MAKQDMYDLEMHNDFINSLITLKEILEDMDKISEVLGLKINDMIRHFEFLEEELRIAVLRNRFLGRPSNFIEEEIDNRKIKMGCKMGI